MIFETFGLENQTISIWNHHLGLNMIVDLIQHSKMKIAVVILALAVGLAAAGYAPRRQNSYKNQASPYQQRPQRTNYQASVRSYQPATNYSPQPRFNPTPVVRRVNYRPQRTFRQRTRRYRPRTNFRRQPVYRHPRNYPALNTRQQRTYPNQLLNERY